MLCSKVRTFKTHQAVSPEELVVLVENIHPSDWSMY
jgi:hypothetical protein